MRMIMTIPFLKPAQEPKRHRFDLTPVVKKSLPPSQRTYGASTGAYPEGLPAVGSQVKPT